MMLTKASFRFLLHDFIMQYGSGVLPSKQNAFVATKALLATSTSRVRQPLETDDSFPVFLSVSQC